MARRIKNLLIAIIILNIIWYVIALAINKDILPNPFSVYAIIPSLFRENIGLDIYASVYRVFWGLLSATAVGVIIGIMIVRLPKFGRIANPMLYFLYPIPKISLLPILMLFLGLGEKSKIGMLFLANVFQVIVSVRDQVRQIPSDLYNSLDVLKASHWQIFKYVTWPASIAGTLSAVRIELSASFAILFMTEVYGTQVGLGYYIMDEWSKMEYTKMYAGIVILSIVAFILFIILEILDTRCNRWRKKADPLF
ncbi:ABC transporter permease [uncultured Lactobacillus sp.]|uniref:ABC transporter permease n=1 Tax=uncultured Lactobacillus sp. TaxID=153152 RepID=UPI002629D9FD|nr:ABC transporter permease subunit [uncultured Lactobacillus sp.]